MKKVLKQIGLIILYVFLTIIGCMIIAFASQKQPVEEEVVSTEVIETKESELFEEYYGKAEGLMYLMTLEEKVGQLFLVRYPSNNDANDEIIEEKPGGYILFERNFENQTKETIKEILEDNQKNSRIPMFFGVDEEGGTVVRVSQFEEFRNERFMSPRELYIKYGLSKILNDSDEKSKLLKSIGINMNLAPVVDVPTNENSFIYDRSFGTDYKKTEEFASEIVKKMNEDKMISVLKHFPGYGDNGDTHTGISIDERPYEQFESVDFKPFISGIKSGAPIILVNHNIVTSMDSELPASLSSKVNNILREELNFSGLVITDDLAMGAIQELSNDKSAAVQAILAGNDMIISSDFNNEKHQILDAIENNEIPIETIDKAVKRILACKCFYGII